MRIFRHRLFLFTLTVGLFLPGIFSCAPPVLTLEELAVQQPEFVVQHSDSLAQAYRDQPDVSALLARAYVAVADSLTRKNPRSDQALSLYNQAHALDPKNADASYGAWMVKGHRYYKQGGRNDLWEGIQAFATAARYRPDSGVPLVWMARSYAKKDDDDFELIIETYNKALNSGLPDELRREAEAELEAIQKRKKVLDDFWK
ncbi:MAG: hypothetical protein GXO90_04795 [FCB group bacterium]|nr:hypothetical protein [FCB group bacterium]